MNLEISTYERSFSRHGGKRNSYKPKKDFHDITGIATLRYEHFFQETQGPR